MKAQSLKYRPSNGMANFTHTHIYICVCVCLYTQTCTCPARQGSRTMCAQELKFICGIAYSCVAGLRRLSRNEAKVLGEG